MARQKKEKVEDNVSTTSEIVTPASEVKAEPVKETAQEVKKVEPKLEVSKATSVKVVGRNNGVVREYSEATHGKDFMKLAAEFAVKKKLKLL